MAIKTFTTGELLTASDTNTYLANAGLVYITGTTLSGTATSIANCFSSTYRNYRIVISSIQTSADADLYFRMLNGTTVISGSDYQWAARGFTASGVSGDSAGSGQTLGYVGWTQSGVANTPIGAVSMDVYAPNAAERTFVTFNSTYYFVNFGSRVGMAEHNLTAAYDGIRFLTNSAATMGGNVAIYGYRQA